MSLLLKKSWHPGLIKNQERVWQEEKRELDERKKTESRLQEIREERQKEEIQHQLEAAGGKRKVDKVDWMYAGPSNGETGTSEELEGFLLGKRRIDNILTRTAENENLKKEAGQDSFMALQNANTAKDLQSKMAEDPLLAIRKQEQAAYESMMKNPAQRKQLMASMGKSSDKPSSHRDDERHSRRRHRHRSHSRERSHRRHRRADSEERDDPRDRRSRHRRSDSRDRYESRRDRDRHSERRGRDRSRSSDAHRDHRRSRRDRSRSPRTSDTRDSRHERRRDYPDEPRRDRRRHDYEDDNSGRRDNRERQPYRNKDRGYNGAGAGGPSSVAGAGDAEERARKLAAMQEAATNLDDDREKRLAALEAKEKAEHDADNQARMRSGKYGEQEFKNNLRKKVFNR